MQSRRGHYIIDDFSSDMVQPLEDRKEPVFYYDRPFIEDNVPDYFIGEDVLGRCFTLKGHVQLRRGLEGHVKERVLEHELAHYDHPEWSEWEVRRRTGTLKPPSEWY